MTKQQKKLAICTALIALALPATAADNQSYNQNSATAQNDRNSTYHNSSTSADRAQKRDRNQNRQFTNRQMSQDCSLSKLMDAEVKSRDGADLGDVQDVLINPDTGKVSYLVLGKGGVLGVGEERVPVPWRAVTVGADGAITVNQDKARFQNAPVAKKDYSDMKNPGYTVSVYEWYAIPLEGAGGGDSPSGMEQGSSSSSWSSSSTDNSSYSSSHPGSTNQWNNTHSTNQWNRGTSNQNK